MIDLNLSTQIVINSIYKVRIKDNMRILKRRTLAAITAVAALFGLVAFALATPTMSHAEEATRVVNISKTDNPGKALAGAQLKVSHKAADGTVVTDAEWTSETSAHTLSLAAGTYTLTEVQAPAGYNKAPDQTFEVKAVVPEATNNGGSYTVGEHSMRTDSSLIADNGSETVTPWYCFNYGKHQPREGNSYTKSEGTKDLFEKMAQQKRTGVDLYSNVLRVINNGYPNNASKIKEKFSLSNEDFYKATQRALWYYTDSFDLHDKNVGDFTREHLDAIEALINSETPAPANMTLDLYRSKDETIQNLLTTHFHKASDPVNVTMVNTKTVVPPTPPVTPSAPPQTPEAAPAPAPQKHLAKTGAGVWAIVAGGIVLLLAGGALVLRRRVTK